MPVVTLARRKEAMSCRNQHLEDFREIDVLLLARVKRTGEPVGLL